MRNRQLGEHSQIKAKIIGQNLEFQTKLTVQIIYGTYLVGLPL